MSPFSLFALSALIGCMGFVTKKARAADQQTAHAFEGVRSGALACKYLLALPTDYDAKGEKRWPLMLFLHGSGERGDNVLTVAKHGPPKLLRQGLPNAATRQLAQNFIVLSPQCPKGKWWDNDTLLALLDDIVASHKVDLNRVYLTGLSMGGYGTWELGLAHPERFAAIAPICGGGSFTAIFMSNAQKRTDLRSMGVWAFHGARDATVPLAESQRLVDALKGQKMADLHLSVYPGAKHDSWTETYSNPELYTWLLSHKRATPPNASLAAFPKDSRDGLRAR